MNRENLKILADYLLALPEGYKDFDMSQFQGHHDYMPPLRIASDINCRTAGCAVGHAPFVKGLPPPELYEGWPTYSERLFGMDCDSDEWEWCFSGNWLHTDNTPQGAAKRIMYLLEQHEELPFDLSNGQDSDVYSDLFYLKEGA